MGKKSLVCLIGFCLVFLCFLKKTPSMEDQISENITKLIEGIDLIPQMEQEQVREYLLLLGDSILSLAPSVDMPQSIQTEMKNIMEKYRKADGAILGEKSVEPLWKAGRFINPDFDLNFPDNPTPETIKGEVKIELNQAKDFHSQGKMDRVEEILIRTLLRIVTPHRR